MEKYVVKNIDPAVDWRSHKYMVIRDCTAEINPATGYWFYGVYDSLAKAQRTAAELGNGLVVETAQVEDKGLIKTPYNYDTRCI